MKSYCIVYQYILCNRVVFKLFLLDVKISVTKSLTVNDFLKKL